MSLDAIGIIAQDPQKTISFYGHLSVTFEKCGEGHFEGALPSGIRLMIDSIELLKEIDPSRTPLKGSGIVLCFHQETPERVNLAYSTLIEQGYRGIKEPWDSFWGQGYSSVEDPDGNQIDLYAPLEKTKNE